jgi:hypothetical protein
MSSEDLNEVPLTEMARALPGNLAIGAHHWAQWTACLLHLFRLDPPDRGAIDLDTWVPMLRCVFDVLVDSNRGTVAAVQSGDCTRFLKEQPLLLREAAVQAWTDTRGAEAAARLAPGAMAFVCFEIDGHTFRYRARSLLEQEDAAMTEAWLYAVVGLAVILVIAAMVVTKKRRDQPPSDEFVALAAADLDEPWCGQLLGASPPGGWTLAAAWTRAGGTIGVDERHRAVEALLRIESLECQSLEFESGTPFDRSKMHAPTGSQGPGCFVHRTDHPGLIQRSIVLEKARVDAGTADYVVLSTMSDDPVTQHLVRSGLRIEPSLSIGAENLVDAGDGFDAATLDRWLAKVIERAPPSTFVAAAEVGERYSERTMRPVRSPPQPARAVVAARRHRGLKRGDALLLKAYVDTGEKS